MCGIIELNPNQSIEKEKLFNLVYNNWHSFGLVLKDANGKVEVIRQVPQKENDPNEIWELLQDNKDLYRLLHVRHNTAGATTMENCHPFDVLSTRKRQVLFMHNGTMHEYVSKRYFNGKAEDDPDGPSDSLNFVDQILRPSVMADFGTGVGDIQNPFFIRMLTKFWPHGNRGILLSSGDAESVKIGDWKFLGEGDNRIVVSNLDYFDRVTRGPEFERRKAAEEVARAKERLEKGESSSGPKKFLTSLRDFNFEEVHGFFKLHESPCKILSDWEVYNRESAVNVGNFSKQELAQIVNEAPEEAVYLMEWIFSDYLNLYKENLKNEEKVQKATQRIAGMVEELKKQRKVG